MLLIFQLLQNFFDPRWTSDGKPYAPARFKQICKERYLISKHTNSDYTSTGDISPTERRYLINFIEEDFLRLKAKMDEAQLH